MPRKSRDLKALKTRLQRKASHADPLVDRPWPDPKSAPDNSGSPRRPEPIVGQIKLLEDRVDELEDRLSTALETVENNQQMMELDIANIKAALGVGEE